MNIHTPGPARGFMGWAQVIIFLVGNAVTFIWFQRGVVDTETTLTNTVNSLSAQVKDLQSTIAQYNADQQGSRTELADIARRLSRIEDKVFPVDSRNNNGNSSR